MMLKSRDIFERTKDDGADDEDVISFSDTSSTYGDQPQYGSEADTDAHEKRDATTDIVGANESKEVRRVKFLIVLVVLVSVFGALAVFFYSRQSEYSRFETTFYSEGNKVLQSVERALKTSLVGLNELSLLVTTVADATNQTFPFVYVPNFGSHVANLAPLNGAVVTYYIPLVTYENRRAWELFSARNNTPILPTYVNDTLKFQEHYPFYCGPKAVNNTLSIHDSIYQIDGDSFSDIPYYNTSRPGLYDIYLPEFQTFPLVMTTFYAGNYDWYSGFSSTDDGLTTMIKNKKVTFSTPTMILDPNDNDAISQAELGCQFITAYLAPGERCMEPLTNFYYPIIVDTSINDITQFNGVVGMITQEFYWRNLLRDILPPESTGLILVVTNDCVNKSFTYQIDGPKETYLGVGDHHDPKYNDHTIKSTISELRNYSVDSHYIGVEFDDEFCPYIFQVYPSEQMQAAMTTNQGIIFAVSAAAFIIFPFIVFLGYERLVSRQQKKLVSSAQRSNAIVESLFPANVRDKLGGDGTTVTPIADLYPETTVLFADIANFTVWASVRDPFAVFTLLEAVYSSFDELATRRNVFKVETIGDCYVAVMGLPVPRRNHAVIMAKFGQEILQVMRVVVSGLDSRLGPGTSELNIRVGLNSGPTTAGVLRGSKERFQLFGDTVNAAARMESNSSPGKILCTQKTADLLIAAGKEHWIKPRKDLVNAKGKGAMQCYWCKPKLGRQASLKSNETGDRTSSTISDDLLTSDIPSDNVKSERLEDWMVTLFEDALVKILLTGRNPRSSCGNEPAVFSTPRQEVSETIVLVDSCAGQQAAVMTDAKVDEVVKMQLQQYITLIAESYRRNEFHNFEHACHVVLATSKLLSRVIKPKESSVSATSYGLTSDPLTHFGILFSAMIHDVDHPGVSNGQLVKENADIAIRYNNQSVAEQNSVTLAWDLLMQSRFDDLRATIANNEEDLKRFRQIVVNSVIATDLFDAELRSFRENRWKKAFDISSESELKDSVERQSSLRAAIVIEHIIQASDVSHTMQHWYVYQKWNKRLFYEMYTAYVSGRAEKDPSIGWYEGEIWFFDNYIIPLAKKLKTCGVFGVSCDELLDYAIDNRDEWKAKGKAIVEKYVASIRSGDVATLNQETNRVKVANALDMASSNLNASLNPDLLYL